MKLVEVEIFDFKSIIKEKITFDSNQVCLVGINESGKSSIIEAISYLNITDRDYSKKLINKSSERYPIGYPVIGGLFELTSNDISYISDLAIIVNPENSIDVKKYKYLFLKRWGNGFDNISILLSDKKNGILDLIDFFKPNVNLFFDKFFSSIFPFIEIYKNEELLIEPATIGELKDTDPRFETFRRLLYLGECLDFDILESDDTNFVSTYIHSVEHKLNKIFKIHYKQDKSIRLKISGFSNRFTLIIHDSTNHGYSIDERSPGFQYYFSFLVNKLYLNSFHKDKNIIYLLDEPGSNLHPQGAKDLLNTFRDITKKNQILYTTHNPFLVLKNNIEDILFVHKSADEGTKIRRKVFLNKFQLLRKELGILLNDGFLIGDFNLVVEGNTEKLAIHRLLNEEEYASMQWVNIYNADGVGNVSQSLNYLGSKNLGLVGLVLLDSDQEAKVEMGRKSFNAEVDGVKWDFVQVNDAFNDKNQPRTFEDLFPQD